MANTTGESKIPVFVSKPLTAKFSTPLANLSNRVRAHLSEPPKLRSSAGSGILSLLTSTSPISRTCKKPSRKNSSSSSPNPYSPATSPSPRPSKLFKSYVADHKPKRDEPTIGQRVVLNDGKPGTVRFIGETKFEDGVWCGVELDTPSGCNDGAVDGVEYFRCTPDSGIFVPLSSISVEKDTWRTLSDSRRASDHASDEATFDLRKVSAPLSQISTPTPSSTNSGNIPIWEWTLGSAHSSSAGSLHRNVNSLDPGNSNLSVISKHSSCELDESLGILTPDQMNDFTASIDCSLNRATSCDNIENLVTNPKSNQSQSDTISDVKYSERSNIHFIENLAESLRLGTENLNESLNLLDGLKDYTSTAFDDNFSCNSSKCLDIERSPSVEDLPIDTVESKPVQITVPTSQPSASFITSVTSIASLDNGYQGDGEFSRPVSRGADHSPTAHQPIVKLKIVDPMTDSDFFTESDADIHEELQGIARGDRRAQVIDGTLYGGVPSSPAKTKSRNSHSNTEEMDSSGVYSDLDKRPDLLVSSNGNIGYPDNLNENLVDQNLSNLSDLIFQKVSAIQIMAAAPQLQSVPETGNALDNTLTAENEDHRSEAGSEVQQLNEKNKSKSAKNLNEVKKHKMPKRNVTSKIKAMLEDKTPKPVDGNEENRQPTTSVSSRAQVKKPVGKWDAVMNKIAANKQEQADKLKPCRLKEVKSKVFAGINMAPPKENQNGGSDAKGGRAANSNSQRKGQPLRNLTITQSNSTRSLTSVKTKSRRCRNRGSESNLENTMKSGDISRGSSHESSLSEASDSISKATSRSSKKSEASSSTGGPVKKGSPSSSPNQKKNVEPRKNPLRDQNRVANNLGQNVITSPPKSEAANGSLRRKAQKSPQGSTVPPPPTNNNSINNNNNNNNNNTCKNNTNVKTTHPPSTKSAPPPVAVPHPAPAAAHVDTTRAQAELRHAAKAVESLSVLIQYLTCDLDGFSAPILKKELSKLKEEWLKTKLELEETQVSYRRLQDETSSQRAENENAIKRLSDESKQELAQLHIEHTQQLDQLKTEHVQDLEKLSKTHEVQLSELTRRLDEQATELRTQFTNELDCLQKNHVEEKEAILQRAKEELAAYKKECEAQLKKVTEEAKQREKILGERLSEVEQQHDALREQSRSIVDGMQNDKDSKVQVTSQYCRKLQDEVDSLRTVLDIRHAELQELRKQNESLQADISEMPLMRQKLLSAQARVEDLSVQLQRKTLFEKQLSEENRMLSESLHCESEKKQKLNYTVEELQYKLKKTQEVASHLASIKDLSSFVDSSVLLPTETIASSTPLEPKPRLCRNLNREYESREPKGRPQPVSTAKKPASHNDEKSEPKSPKVISVVEKSDSVSWVLAIDDPSDGVVSRLVRKQSGRGLSQPNSNVCSPVRQDQNRSEPKPRLHSQSSLNKKSKKPALRPRSISFNGEKTQKMGSPTEADSSHTIEAEESSYNSQYITANNWEEPLEDESPVWDKDMLSNGDHFPESCQFIPSEISGASSLKIMNQDDAINFDSDFEFFEKSEHFDIIDADKPEIQITGGEDFASPKFSTSSLTSESSVQSNASSNHFELENGGISLEHEEFLLINSNCQNTNKITLVNRLSPEKRKTGSSYGETSDDDISSSSKYDNETDDGSSGSGSDYLEKDGSYSSQDDYLKEYSRSDDASEKVVKNGEHSINGEQSSESMELKIESLPSNHESTNGDAGIHCDNSLNASQKQKSLENLAAKSSMKDKRSISFDTGRQMNACNYPSFITLEKISFINKSLESSGMSHSKSFSSCDERERKNAKYTNGIETTGNAKLNQHKALSVDS